MTIRERETVKKEIATFDFARARKVPKASMAALLGEFFEKVDDNHDLVGQQGMGIGAPTSTFTFGLQGQTFPTMVLSTVPERNPTMGLRSTSRASAIIFFTKLLQYDRWTRALWCRESK
jgi:hypothetical protein